MTNLSSRQELTQQLKAEAERLGFGLSGACPAVTSGGISRLQQWLDAGYAGGMAYLSDRRQAYDHPGHVLNGARSILMLGMHYRTAEPQPTGPGQGRVSRYAWGNDYHDLVRKRLNELAAFLKSLAPEASARGVIDTAPLLERDYAQMSGLGWIGKNTLLINKFAGSYFFLAALLTDLELAYDEPHEASHCGTCRACLDACPTDAFVDAHVLDARKCISYLTIELRGPIPSEQRPRVGDWLLGCDVCQDVCPWNHRAPHSEEPDFLPAAAMNPMDLAALFWLDDAGFRQRFRHSPLWRPKRRGILRNAAIVLGNRPSADAVNALVHGLQDAESLVRGACAWALGGQPSATAQRALAERLEVEADADVLVELRAAIDRQRQDHCTPQSSVSSISASG